MEWSEEERAANLQLYKEHCEGMSETFQYLVDTEELSRMPTQAEMEKVKPILLKKITDGEWGDSEQELVAILCSAHQLRPLCWTSSSSPLPRR